MQNYLRPLILSLPPRCRAAQPRVAWAQTDGGRDLAIQELAIARRTLRRVLAGTAAVTPSLEDRLARLCGIPDRFQPDLLPAHALPDTLLTEIPARNGRIL